MPKQVRKARGLILRKTRIRGTSLIVNLLSSEGELLSLNFKGVLSSKRHLSAHLVPFAVIEVVYYPRPDIEIFTASQAYITEDFPDTKLSYEESEKAGRFVSLVREIVKPAEPFVEAYDLLCAIFRNWNELKKIPFDLLLAGFMLKILTFAGFGTQLHQCTICGRQIEMEGETRYMFSPQKGGIVCNYCKAPLDAIQIFNTTYLLLRMLLASPFTKYEKLGVSSVDSNLLLDLMKRFWVTHIGDSADEKDKS